MCAFAQSRCGGFEAVASHGYLHANVTNTGKLAAGFALAMANCSAGVREAPAQKLSLGAGETAAAEPFQVWFGFLFCGSCLGVAAVWGCSLPQNRHTPNTHKKQK